MNTLHDTTRTYPRTGHSRKAVQINSGERYGLFTVISEGARHRRVSGTSVRTVMVVCDCGTQKTVWLSALRSGVTVSCGCFHREQTRALGKSAVTHGASRTKNYRRWSAMIARCHSTADASYERYGARGIYVIARWRDSYQNFLEDMGDPPAGMTIDRIDSSGPYCKENCRWAGYKTQARNTSRNVYITIKGERLLLLDAAERYGFNARSMQTALLRGRSRLFKKYGVETA